MSKLACICGHTIRDQTDFIPYKASFIRDQDSEAHSSYSEVIDSFIEALKTGKRTQWLESHFSADYPTDLSDASIISDIVSQYDLNFRGTLYQCENCSRVKIQIQNTNHFASFTPEDDDGLGIFKRAQK